MTARPPQDAGTTRRALLGGLGLAGLGAATACGGSPAEPAASPPPTPTPTTTASPSPTERPFVPDGLEESQRSEYRYGDGERQVSDLWLPQGDHRDAIVVLVHGGGYQAGTSTPTSATSSDVAGRC